jgi:hypothetical protein
VGAAYAAELGGEAEAITFRVTGPTRGIIVAAVRDDDMYQVTSELPAGLDGDPAESLQALLDSWLWVS